MRLRYECPKQDSALPLPFQHHRVSPEFPNLHNMRVTILQGPPQARTLQDPPQEVPQAFASTLDAKDIGKQAPDDQHLWQREPHLLLAGYNTGRPEYDAQRTKDSSTLNSLSDQGVMIAPSSIQESASPSRKRDRPSSTSSQQSLRNLAPFGEITNAYGRVEILNQTKRAPSRKRTTRPAEETSFSPDSNPEILPPNPQDTMKSLEHLNSTPSPHGQMLYSLGGLSKPDIHEKLNLLEPNLEFEGENEHFSHDKNDWKSKNKQKNHQGNGSRDFEKEREGKEQPSDGLRFDKTIFQTQNLSERDEILLQRIFNLSEDLSHTYILIKGKSFGGLRKIFNVIQGVPNWELIHNPQDSRFQGHHIQRKFLKNLSQNLLNQKGDWAQYWSKSAGIQLRDFVFKPKAMLRRSLIYLIYVEMITRIAIDPTDSREMRDQIQFSWEKFKELEEIPPEVKVSIGGCRRGIRLESLIWFRLEYWIKLSNRQELIILLMNQAKIEVGARRFFNFLMRAYSCNFGYLLRSVKEKGSNELIDH